jgi:hypothetical protein
MRISQICQRKRLGPSPNTASLGKLDGVIQIYHMGDFQKSDILRKAHSFSVKFSVLMSERWMLVQKFRSKYQHSFFLVSMLATARNSIETDMT